MSAWLQGLKWPCTPGRRRAFRDPAAGEVYGAEKGQGPTYIPVPVGMSQDLEIYLSQAVAPEVKL